MKKIDEIKSYSVPGSTTRQQRTAIARLVRNLPTVDQTCTSSRLKGHHDSVVTGCNHVASIIMKSSTTGYKRLKEWEKLNIIKLHKIVSFTPVKSKEGAFAFIDYLKEMKIRGIHFYSKKEGGVKTILGNRVLSFNSFSLKLGEAAIDSTLRLTNT